MNDMKKSDDRDGGVLERTKERKSKGKGREGRGGKAEQFAQRQTV
jgi:hypothetical protein